MKTRGRIFPTFVLIGLLLTLLSACGPAGGQATLLPQPSSTPFQPATNETQIATAQPGGAAGSNPGAQGEAGASTAQAGAPTIAVPASQTGQQQPAAWAVYRSGQTFITWLEQTQLTNERYRVYRSTQPLTTAEALSQARLLGEVGRDSSRFYANIWKEDQALWHPRFLDRLVSQDGAASVSAGTGMLVWTLAPEDFSGQTSGAGYYAITVTPAGGSESLLPGYTLGPVQEQVQDPQPVEITHSPGVDPGAGEHVYIQYMDLHHWNGTYYAPNSYNEYYGLDPNAPGIAHNLAYAFDYAVFTPDPKLCGGSLPEKLPVLVYLHGAKGWRYTTPHDAPYAYCAYIVNPIDMSDTWYFGFAQKHDYRQNSTVEAGDVIENYTEQRILRMIYDLQRNPPGPAADEQRVYIFGHSMGGSGTLGFAERYPNVFAAGYSAEPISNYQTAGITHNTDWAAGVAIKWGAQALNLPIANDGPGSWAAHLQKYNGTGVWDWQNYQAHLSADQRPERLADEMVPLGVDSGIKDHVLSFATQGRPFFPLLHTSPRVWAGVATDLDHDFSHFAGLPPSLGMVNDTPFWNLQAVRDETVPALSFLSSNNPNPPDAPTPYNQTIKWSSSWDAWDGAPVDQPEEWRMSFCAVTQGSLDCASEGSMQQMVYVTPRRLQHFKVTPGAVYDWENRTTSDQVIASGTVNADANGLITVKDFLVLPGGSRLVLRPHK